MNTHQAEEQTNEQINEQKEEQTEHRKHKHRHKRRHGTIYQHVQHLRVEYLCCVLMILIILALQAYDWLILGDEWDDYPPLLGSKLSGFRITTVNCFPFFLIPCTVLAVFDQILKQFFARNGDEMSERIPRYERHPHTRYQKAFTRMFIAVTLFLSVVCCTAITVQKGIWTQWIGLFASGFAMAFLWKCARRLRRSKRDYLRQRARRKKAVTEETEETTETVETTETAETTEADETTDNRSE